MKNFFIKKRLDKEYKEEVETLKAEVKRLEEQVQKYKEEVHEARMDLESQDKQYLEYTEELKVQHNWNKEEAVKHAVTKEIMRSTLIAVDVANKVKNYIGGLQILHVARTNKSCYDSTWKVVFILDGEIDYVVITCHPDQTKESLLKDLKKCKSQNDIISLDQEEYILYDFDR